MNTSSLFAAAVLIWGTTWFAITLQLPAVAPEPGVALRFALASAIVLAWCAWRGIGMRLPPAAHAWLALQGALGYSVSYVLIYHAERFIVSGLVAVGYAAAPLVNMLLARAFFGTAMSRRVAAGGLLGLAGIALVFWADLAPLLSAAEPDRGFVLGAAFTAIAVLASCCANMITLRLQRDRVSGWPPIGIGMAYGATCSLGVALALGSPLAVAWSVPFAASLLYLSLVGSVLAFGAYFTLLARVGAARASYVGVMTPLVALVVSTLLEQFAWRPATVAGVVLAVLGNVLALRPPAPRRSVESPP
jgi:drug/metabolite transporter (DMT)-like permease